MYHQWLKPGQFAARYGVSQQDLAKVAAWLRSQGFTVTAIPASNDRDGIQRNGGAGECRFPDANASISVRMENNVGPTRPTSACRRQLPAWRWEWGT